MNDDELIERLRGTLRAEADAVSPMQGTPRVSPRRPRPHRDSLLNRAVVVLASAAAVAAAVAVTLGLTRGGSHPVSTITSTPAVSAPTTVGRPATTSTTRRPSHSLRSSPTTVTVPTTPATSVPTLAPTTTVAPPITDAVPASFTPVSVTFISTTVGWVLGTEPCAAGTCLHLAARGIDGLWTDQLGPSGPGTLTAARSGRLQVRFADPLDGWIYEVGAGSYWATHDGGASWTAGTLPGAIDSLESSGGVVVVAVTTTDGRVIVDSSPADATAFGPVAQIAAPTSGTTPTATVVLQSTDARDPVGWVLAGNDRGPVGGLRLDNGTWSTWASGPCAATAGAPLLAASNPDHLVAVCEPAKSGESVEVSSDGGKTFVVTGGGLPLPVTAVATPAVGTIVGVSSADPGSLVASLGSGVWRTVESDARTGDKVVQVGFEDSAQGVAIVDTGASGMVLETTDGGATWNQVTL